MSIYDLLVDQMQSHIDIARSVEEDSMTLKRSCTICKKAVTDSDEYVLETGKEKDIRLTHWKCYADKKRKKS